MRAARRLICGIVDAENSLRSTREDVMDKDQIDLEAFFASLLDDYKAGALTKAQAVGGLVHFAVALNRDDFDEARRWARQGRKLSRDLVSVEEALLLLSRPPSNNRH
jgi:hypothetical protein